MSNEGFSFCTHCGAMWDDNHEKNGCPVMGATARILGATEDQAEEVQRKKRHGLKEKLQAVLSGRAGW
jgi:predicted  nucleic acid-binding Zn-ribbon protein